MAAKALRRAGLLIFGSLVALAAAEAALRGAGRAYAYWRLPEAAIDKAAVRVLCVGDSFTFGLGAPKGKSYPEQLQGLLDRGRGASRFQVIDAGVPGSNSSQLLARLGSDLTAWRPSILIVMTGWNDKNLAGSNYWRVLTPAQMPWLEKAGFYVRDFMASCRIYKLLAAAWQRLPHPKPTPTRWDRYAAVSEAEASAELARLRSEEQRDPAHFHKRLDVGILYHKIKKFPEALDAYRRAVKDEPDNAEAHYQLAWMFHLLRDFENAKIEVQEALRLDPSDPRARGLMGNYVARSRNSMTPDDWLEPLLRYDLARIVELAQERGARVILQTYPNPNPLNDKLRDAYARLALKYRFEVVDQSRSFTSLPDAKNYYSGDEPELLVSHLNARGYALMAQNLLAKVSPD